MLLTSISAHALTSEEQRNLNRAKRLSGVSTQETGNEWLVVMPTFKGRRQYNIEPEKDRGPFSDVIVWKANNESARSLFVVARTPTRSQLPNITDLYNFNGSWYPNTTHGSDYAFTATPRNMHLKEQEVKKWKNYDALQEKYDVSLNGDSYIVQQYTIAAGRRVYTIFHQVIENDFNNEKEWFDRAIGNLRSSGEESVDVSNSMLISFDSGVQPTVYEGTTFPIGNIAPGIVHIERKDPKTGKVKAKGTGFFVTEQGWIISNKHVVELHSGVPGMLNITMTDSTEQQNSKCSFTLPGTDVILGKNSDVALMIPSVRIPCPVQRYFSPFNGIADTGTAVHITGYPGIDVGGDTLTSTTGQVTGRVMAENNVEYLKITAEASAGHSGGPVFDNSERFVGITTAVEGIIQLSEGVFHHLITLAVPSKNIVDSFPELSADSQPEQSEGSWYSRQKDAFSNAGYLEHHHFQADHKAQRWEFISLVVDLLGGADASTTQQSFSDIPIDAEYAAAFETAGHIGLVRGAGDCYGTLPCNAQPHALINRAEAATLLLRAFDLRKQESFPEFGDNPGNAWFARSIQTAASLCILKGDDGSLRVRPGDHMNWAEMLVMLYRVKEGQVYPMCQSKKAVELPAAPGRTKLKTRRTKNTSSSASGTPCTLAAWNCQPMSTCTKKGKQYQTCTLVDKQCIDPERARPPGTIGCTPRGGRVVKMEDTLDAAKALHKRMGEIVLRLSSGDVIDGIDVMNKYEEAIDVYSDLVDGAKRYNDWFQLKDNEITFQEEWLENLEKKFFEINGAWAVLQELEEEESE